MDPFDQGKSKKNNQSSVCILGGGLAGIAAAVRLAQHNYAVTLIEKRKHLGGRATSFVDPKSEQLIDNCQHILMGCCTNLIDLYQRLGVADKIQWHRKLYFIDEKKHVDELLADDLPAPIHMTRSLMGFHCLTWFEKLCISRAMLAMMQITNDQRKRLNYITFAQWLSDHHQPSGAIDKFWSLITISALNETIDRVAANYAIQVFQDGFLANESAYLMGVPAVPLTELYDAAERVITEAGGCVLCSTQVDQLAFMHRNVSYVSLRNGDQLKADCYISALPFQQLANICSLNMLKADDRLRRLDRIDTSPIIGIHLWIETDEACPPMSLPHAALLHSPLHWVFNKGYDSDTRSQYLHGVVSAAYDLVDKSPQQILDMAIREVRQRIPGCENVILKQGKVIKERKATFSATVGFESLRPRARGDIGNLLLAGDWCQTGWPATMEGAVRSGYQAARQLLDDEMAVDKDLLAADLPPGDLYRIIHPK